MAELKPIIEESFSQYAGAVLQSRALADVRDCLKPSARQIFYCMETDGFTENKPFKKTLKSVGSAMRLYIHGDSSCVGVIMRAGQPFVMRYPLVEIEGSYGNLMESGNWSAPRYTSSRLSSVANYLFADMKKNTIEEWRDNYDDTEQYPAVLPSKGFYNICNGGFGIGIGLSSSIPQFNIKELNSSLIRLLQNPEIADEELIIMPDFATGGLLLNPAEVRESLKNGQGKACKLRSVITYSEKENCLIVTEIPYGVYTDTICRELDNIVNGDENPGIDIYKDLTKGTPLIEIYLKKGINYNRVLDFLYKNTSLQSFYSINMTMLEDGRFPKVFTWKQALQAHIDHEKIVYRKGFEFDKAKAQDRVHIVNGLLIALANIDEVVTVIKHSSNNAEAIKNLIENFVLDGVQAKAILDIKLARLAKLEVNKLVSEKEKLEAEIARITEILETPELFNGCLIAGWQETAKKFGDPRRTKVQEEVERNEEETEKSSATLLYLVLDNDSILPLIPEDKIVLNKKNAVITKQKVKFGFMAKDTSIVYAFDKSGRMYLVNCAELGVGMENEIAAKELVQVLPTLEKDYLITVSKNGIIKKTAISEYTKSRRSGAAVKIKEGDELLWCGCAAEHDNLLLLGAGGGVLKLAVSSISATGRTTVGIKGMADVVVSAAIGHDTEEVVCIAEGKGKRTPISEFHLTAKGGKGQVIAEKTTLIAKVDELYYLIDDAKITRCSKKTLALKGKTAVGAKIANSESAKIISI